MAGKPVEDYWLKIGSKTQEELSVKVDKSPKVKPPPREKYYLKIGNDAVEELTMTVSQGTLPRHLKTSQLEDCEVENKNFRKSWSASNTNISVPNSNAKKKYQRSKTVEHCSIGVVKNKTVDLISPRKLIAKRQISNSLDFSSNQGSSHSLDVSQPSSSSLNSNTFQKSDNTPLHLQTVPKLERASSSSDTFSNKDDRNESILYENIHNSQSNRLDHSYNSENQLCDSDSRNSLHHQHSYENVNIIYRESLVGENSSTSNSVDCPSNNRLSNNSALNLKEVYNDGRNIFSQNNETNLAFTGDYSEESNNTQLRIYENSDVQHESDEVRDMAILEQFQQSICDEILPPSRPLSINRRNSSFDNQSSTSSISETSLKVRGFPEGKMSDDSLSLNKCNSNQHDLSRNQHSKSKSKKKKTIEQCTIAVKSVSGATSSSLPSTSLQRNVTEHCSIVVSSNIKKDKLLKEHVYENLPSDKHKNKKTEKCIITKSKNLINKPEETQNGELRQNPNTYSEQCSITVKNEASVQIEKNIFDDSVVRNTAASTSRNIENKISKKSNDSSNSNDASNLSSKPIQSKRVCTKPVENCSIIVTKHHSHPIVSGPKTPTEICSIKTVHHPLIRKRSDQQLNKQVEQCSIFVKRHSDCLPIRTSSLSDNNRIANLEENEVEDSKPIGNYTSEIPSTNSIEEVQPLSFESLYPNLKNLESVVLELLSENCSEENNTITTAADVHVGNEPMPENLSDSNNTICSSIENLNNLTERTETRENLEGTEGRPEAEMPSSSLENSKQNVVVESESVPSENSPDDERALSENESTLPDISVSATVILRQRSQSSLSESSSDSEELNESSSPPLEECREDPPGQESITSIEEQTSDNPASPRRLRWYVVQVHENLSDNSGLEAPPPYDAIYRNELSRGRPFRPPTYEEACRTSHI